MKGFIKRNLAVILAFALPLLLIIIVAVSTYLPSFLFSTDYDFVYAACGSTGSYDYHYGYSCNGYLQQKLAIEGGGLILKEVSPITNPDKGMVPAVSPNYKIRFFLHDTEKNEGREI